MLGLGFLRPLRCPPKFTFPSLISCVFVFISQLALAMVPRHFSSWNLLAKLAISALLLLILSGFAKSFKRLLRVHASAPALVFFNALFIWGTHFSVIQKAIPSVMNIAFNLEFVMLMVGFYSILSSDPGWVSDDGYGSERLIQTTVSHAGLSCEGSFTMRRVRYCKRCKQYVRGFDHHCPAFGNCIGQKNHVLFMVLLLGFIMVEISYIFSSTQFSMESEFKDGTLLESSLSGNLVISTMLFSVIQVLWQVVFLIWHIYCVCFNIKTEEWINWKKYSEFQLPAQAQPGEFCPETRFRNPYDKGILGNIMEFLSLKE